MKTAMKEKNRNITAILDAFEKTFNKRRELVLSEASVAELHATFPALFLDQCIEQDFNSIVKDSAKFRDARRKMPTVLREVYRLSVNKKTSKIQQACLSHKNVLLEVQKKAKEQQKMKNEAITGLLMLPCLLNESQVDFVLQLPVSLTSIIFYHCLN